MPDNLGHMISTNQTDRPVVGNSRVGAPRAERHRRIYYSGRGLPGWITLLGMTGPWRLFCRRPETALELLSISSVLCVAWRAPCAVFLILCSISPFKIANQIPGSLMEKTISPLRWGLESGNQQVHIALNFSSKAIPTINYVGQIWAKFHISTALTCCM